MKILVTGANGFLGSKLVDQLSREGHTVTVLIRRKPEFSTYEERGIRVSLGDVTQKESLMEAVQGQEQIYHLAGLVAYDRRLRESLFKVNATGTENICEIAAQNKVHRLLLVSSVVAVGATFEPHELTEASEYNLHKYNLGYHESKIAAEAVLKKYVQSGQLDGVIVNPSTIYGAGDASKGSRSTQLKVAQGKLLFYPPGGVSVVSVEDVIDGILKAMKLGKSGERYILSGENLTLKQVFELIATKAGVPPPQFKMPSSAFWGLKSLDEILQKINLKGPMPSERCLVALMYHWYDCQKAKKELGFKPRPAELAIANSVQWMKQNGLLESK